MSENTRIFQERLVNAAKAGSPGVTWTGQTIRQTLVLIDKSVIGAVLFVDDREQLLGFVTDGDIRRAFIAGANLDEPISAIWNAKPFVMSAKSTITERHDMLADHELSHVIIAEDGGRRPRVQTAREVQMLYERNPRSCPVLVMAGGRGMRLMPLTANCPKPMIEVAGKPLLHHTIERLAAQGYQDVFLSVRYLKEQIQDYFGDGDSFGVNIRYLEEAEPLGTGGCLRLLPPLKSRTLLVLNGDVITDLRFRSLVSFHENEGYQATMVVHEVADQIAYGVVRKNGTAFRRLEEKPMHRFHINTGIYALSTSAFDAMPNNPYFGMPDLFARLTERDRECGVYEHHGRWIDIGDHNQLDLARNELSAVLSTAHLGSDSSRSNTVNLSD